MSDSMMKCVNCGRQVIIDDSDPPDVICYWCHKPALIKTKKEEPMVTTNGGKNGIKAEELTPDVLAKLGAPMPAKPETAESGTDYS